MTTRNNLGLAGCICVAVALASGLVHSQTSNGDPPDNDIGGNDSPAGVDSGFNGWVNTACAYDPYTGNARRTVDDIIVPGTLGAYPLKWTRYYNSRDADVGNPLGLTWRHSYMWSEDYYGGNIIRFPDGREVDFNEPSGISERLPQAGLLQLGDGGQVIFDPMSYTLPNGQYVRYRVARIIDPYGLTTTISYETTGQDDYGNDIYRIARITEPGGRYLQLSYSPADEATITGVTAFTADGNATQSVTYAYSNTAATGGVYMTLSTASYSDGTVAQYTYQNDNSGKSSSPKIPLLQTCDDVRYSGPMHQIQYAFVQGDRIRGKIKSEVKPGTGEAVSTLTFPSTRGQTQTRVETRGDGPKRTFTYDTAGRLVNYRDFKNSASIITQLGYDGGGFVASVTTPGTDAGPKATGYIHETNIGQITQVTHPDGSYVHFEYTDWSNPYYLWWKSDERAAYVGDPQHTIRYDRDPATHRVTQITYPDGATESFWYTDFGQIRTHQRRNGAYEHFGYDAKKRLTTVWNPTPSGSYPPDGDVPYVGIYYYESGPWADRVFEVLDQYWRSTMYEYDRDAASQPCAGRGLPTRITHVDGSYVSFAYDQLGNVIAAENELRKRTNYAYDDYNRVITVTPPAPAGAITVTYEKAGTADSYLHTARAAHLVTDGAGVTAETIYDENFRRASVTQIDGTNAPPTTSFQYWPAGLLRLVHDPRGYDWTYTYTDRYQLLSTTNPRTETISRHYDPAGNMDYIDRPDHRRVTQSYDGMNRLQSIVEPVSDSTNKQTTFTYWPSGRVRAVQDDNGQITTFEYDASDLQTRMVYPDGTSDQRWGYDNTNTLTSRRTVGGKTQLFYPDARNRITDMNWDEPSNVSDWAHFDYDAASQLVGARNENGTITRQYDDAGRLLTEEQNVYGLASPKTVTYASDAAGKRTALGIATTAYQFAYHYDTLGRLDQILNVQDTSNGPVTSMWFQYSYDAASNQVQRYCPMNGVAQIYDRDELGRVDNITIRKATQPQSTNIAPPEPPPISATVSSPTVPVPTLRPLSLLAGLTNLATGAGESVPTVGDTISSEQYTFDVMGRVTDVHRTGTQAGGWQANGDDRYDYDYSGQLSGGTYTNWSGAATRSVSYAQDKLGNRSQVTDNGSAQGYSRNGSYLNQYSSAPGGAISNGNEHEIAGYEGVNYGYIGDQKLTSVTANGNAYYLAYDALGRCVKRALNGATVFYTYDGPHPIYEWKADSTRAGWNLYGQGIDEILLRADYQVLSDGQGYFFQQNRLGSVTLLTGFAGEPDESYRYDAFGAFNEYLRGSLNNRFRFTGREYQPNFGIYEYRNRAYHPGLGRFLSEDPMGFGGGDTNMFRYCGGDPVNRRDAFGLHEEDGDGPEVPYQNEAMGGGGTYEYNGDSSDFMDRVMSEVFGDNSSSSSYSGPSGAVAAGIGVGVGLGGTTDSSGFSGAFGPALGGNGLGILGGGGDTHASDGGGSVGDRIFNSVFGANHGEAWRTMFSQPWVPGPTGGYLPPGLAAGLNNVRGMIPSNAAANGFHAWHAGSNAYLAQQLGFVGMPAIILGGLFHESPLDWESFKAEQRSQGTVNHVLDSSTDIIANVFGMNVGYIQSGQRGVNTAIYFGNYIPGPSDFGEHHSYNGDPTVAWGPYR